jgi:hypothetical protein
MQTPLLLPLLLPPPLWLQKPGAYPLLLAGVPAIPIAGIVAGIHIIVHVITHVITRHHLPSTPTIIIQVIAHHHHCCSPPPPSSMSRG